MPEDAREAHGGVIRDGKRTSEVIRQTRALGKKEPPPKNDVEINKVILEIISLIRGELMKDRVSVQTQLAEGLPLIRGD